ncbi:MAG: amidase [Candidatus Caldarchaeum sp.]|jgi:aspartyl-tRNA(Asn)/glutamyl-tRNA(Gln) amidotransferase subunit A
MMSSPSNHLPSLRRLFSSRNYNPEERWRKQYRVIEEKNDVFRAYITVFPKPVVERSFRRKVLRGISFGVKDVFHIKGYPTTAGSKLLSNMVSSRTAAVVSRIIEAGGAVNGKTNLHEFAFGVSNINPFYGACLNPYDTSRVSGGSSGGSAVAVALGMCDVGLGTDTAGSVRVPAAFCGVVGFKPTSGHLSTDGVIPLSWSMDHVGILSRSVWETILVYSVLVGKPLKPAEIRPLSLERLRIGVPRNYFLDLLDRHVEEAFEKGLKTLEQKGAVLEEVVVENVEKAARCRSVIAFAEAAAYHLRLSRGRLSEYGQDVRDRIVRGLAIPAAAYLNALRARKKLMREFEKIFTKIDVLATPTTLIPAHRVDEENVEIEGRLISVREASLKNTEPFNLYGAPAISIPAGNTPQGLPIGVQLVGPRGEDMKLLRIALAVEKAFTASS